MSIQEQLQNDLKEAMKARESLRVEVIRGARAALQSAQQEARKQRYDAARREAQKRGLSDREEDRGEDGLTPMERALSEIQGELVTLDEAAQEQVIAREVKRRRDAAEAYRQAGQTERQEQEEAEARILEEYLPKQLSADELRPQVAAIVAELGASGPADMGKVMPVLVERFKGRADNRMLSQLAREALGST